MRNSEKIRAKRCEMGLRLAHRPTSPPNQATPDDEALWTLQGENSSPIQTHSEAALQALLDLLYVDRVPVPKPLKMNPAPLPGRHASYDVCSSHSHEVL